MNNEMTQVWQEIIADITTSVILWQLLVLLVSVISAWFLHEAFLRYTRLNSSNDWQAAIQALNRILFPISSYLMVLVGRYILHFWQHTSMLKIVGSLFLSLALIRLIVYVMRYVFVSSGWVQKTESLVATSIWVMMALHISGFLPEIVDELKNISISFGSHEITLYLAMQALVTICLTIIFALWLSRFIENKIMLTTHFNMNMRVVLSKVVRIILSVFAVLFAFSSIGLDLTLLSVFGGALGVGLGFGLQKIASNFVSGFIILLDDSMQLGDLVTVDNHYGVVSDLRARYMVLKKLDGTEVVIPNESLIINPVINHSLTDHKCRVHMPIQISYSSNLDLAIDLIKSVVIQQSRVLHDPAPDVLIKAFGDNGIDLSISFWIPDPEEGSATLQSNIYLEVWRNFQKNDITIPYPQREIRIVNPSKV